MSDIELAMTIIRDGAQGVGANFDKPDDDWLPIAFLVADGRVVTTVILDFSSPAAKEHMLEVELPKTIQQYGAKAAAIVASAWRSVASPRPDGSFPDTADIPRPSEDVNRVEVLWLVGADGERQVFEQAEIVRHDDAPPTLQEWERQGEDGTVEGLIPDALRSAFAG